MNRTQSQDLNCCAAMAMFENGHATVLLKLCVEKATRFAYSTLMQLTQSLTEIGNRIARSQELSKEIWVRKKLSAHDKQRFITLKLLIGLDLIQAKRRLGHGKWLVWFREYFPTMSERMARRYMAAAEGRGRGRSLRKILENQGFSN